MPTQRIQNLNPEKLQSIVTAALVEFSEHHFRDASFNRIIKRSGISKGSMYYYFESKEDLFLALVKHTFEKLAPLKVPTPIFDKPEQYWQETRRLTGWLFDFFAKQPKLGRFIQNVTTDYSRAEATPAGELLAAIDDWLQDFLVTGQMLGAVRRDLPLELLSCLCWSTWQTLNAWLAEQKEELSTEKRVEVIVDGLWRLLEP